MFEMYNTDIVDATFRNQVRRLAEGNGVIDGCQVTVGSSSAGIEIDIASGAVQIDYERVEVAPQTVIADDGEVDAERTDIVYIAENGEGQIAKGDPADTASDEVSIPPDTASVAGVVLAGVRIPEGASATGELAGSDVRDRRLPAIELDRVDIQTASIPPTEMAAGEYASVPVYVEAGMTAELYAWGASHIDSGDPQGLPTGVELQVIGPQGGVVESEGTFYTRSSPVWTATPTGTEPELYQLRLHNGSETDFNPPEGLTAHFEYAIIDY